MIQAIQYSEVIIPCKPTSKSVEVQLIKDDEEVCIKFICLFYILNFILGYYFGFSFVLNITCNFKF